MKLMFIMESYWDMLPPEIHELILAYKRSQEWIDEERKDRMKDLCIEIEKYEELRIKWGIGHVKCIVKKNLWFICGKHHIHIGVVMWIWKMYGGTYFSDIISGMHYNVPTI